MDNNKITQNHQMRKKWVFLLSITTSLVIFLCLMIISSYNSKTLYFKIPRKPTKPPKKPSFVESNLKISSTASKERVPKIAYLVSGSRGDGESIRRTLMALYHPLNQYALHLDLEAPTYERLELVNFVEKNSVFSKVGNVRVIEKSNLVTYRGPTMVTNTLHAMAILMKDGGVWDWFINLSASDYPLVTQDDLLHVLSTLPRELNFIEHTSDIGWKEFQRARPVIIDPGLYSSQKSDVFWVPEQRSIPTAFKLFTGSAWMMLSRPFVEYCLWGWDNLPRTILMYYANFLSSPEGYFHTVICNVEEFKNTTVNHDLHFISWDTPPKQHPHFLTSDDYRQMVDSNAPFARKFGRKESVLDQIDSELLGRDASGFVPGKWLVSGNGNTTVVNTTELKPGFGADRLKRLVTKLLSVENFHPRQCTSIPL
ncbi:hypothetical protein RND81_08G063200 [Saponaria officinalis]|uniref:Uncharacterized protein n=1 Tax=Saponaria officinalis TaxID=3572 RepID=A0AAW1J336_SAPOF